MVIDIVELQQIRLVLDGRAIEDNDLRILRLSSHDSAGVLRHTVVAPHATRLGDGHLWRLGDITRFDGC